MTNPQMRALSDADFSTAYTKQGAAKLAALLQVKETTVRSRALRLGVAAPKHPKRGSFGSLHTRSDEQLQADVELLGTVATAQLYGVDVSTVQRRIKAMGVVPAKTGAGITTEARQHPQRVQIEVQNGTVLVFSDAHYWPGNPGPAHRALVKLAHEMAPKAVICNGDAVDMAAVSRHPPIGWEAQPTVQQEIECAQERLGEIIAACTGRGCRRTWNLGNHDARFETRLATVAPEYAKLTGIHLHDHFPEWERAWSTWINDSVVIKHRYKGGAHATHNNTVASGKTMITGHLHSAKVTPYTDYNGTRYGMDTGCLADTYGRQFTNYTEDNPLNWISAFGVLTFRHGKLLWPEIVAVYDEQSVQFRGQIIEV